MLVVVDTCWEAFVLSKHTRLPESVFENSLYCSLSISQSPIQCRGLPVDDVQKCDCWHHHFSLLFFLESVSCEGFCQSPRYVRSLSNKPRCQGIEYWHFFVNYENKYLARTWLVSTLEAFRQWTGCSFLYFTSQELQVTLSLFMAVNHLPLEIKIMITNQTKTVPCGVMGRGGTTCVTDLTWMASIDIKIPHPTAMVWTGTTGRDTHTP